MQSQWKLAAVIGAVAAAAAFAYGELVLDMRTPRASLASIHAITTSVSVLTADYNQVVEAMKKKYSPSAETAIENRSSVRFVTRVGGRVVEEKRAGTFSDARGLFVIGPRDHLESTFPFEIDPRKPPKSGTVGVPGVRYLKGHFGEKFPAKYLEFDDRDATTGTCATIPDADFGWLSRPLQLRSGAFCVVFWKGHSPGSMLVSVVLADGDPWMRPFSRRICRLLTTVALARLAVTDPGPPPDYAACLLVDRPDRSGANEVLQEHVYQLRRDASLAYVN